MLVQNAAIKANFPLYLELVAALKTPEDNPVVLSIKPNHRLRLAGSIALLSPVDTNVHLLAEKAVNSASHYGLKIQARNLCPHPIIRFEADGPRHHNPMDKLPLVERFVDTPHFHRFNEDGYEFAYRIDAFKNPQVVVEVQQGINNGLRYFCEEGKVASTPPLGIAETQLEFPPKEYDPLEGVRF